MFRKEAAKIIEMMKNFPMQIFGVLDEDLNDAEGRQDFIIGSSTLLSNTFPSSTKFIMSANKTGISSIVNLKFSAYYLPAIFNGMKELTLGDKCDVLITDVLTGCTFVAVKLNDKFKVYHLNSQDEAGKIDQNKIDAMINMLPRNEKANIVFMLTKKDYKHSDNPVSIVGIRSKDNHWSFHYQISKNLKKEKTYETSFTYENTMNTEEKSSLQNDKNIGIKR